MNGDTLDGTSLADGTPLEVNITTPTESEIQIGGDGFLVKIRSSSELGEVAQLARELYLECRPSGKPAITVGYAAPQFDLRHTEDCARTLTQ